MEQVTLKAEPRATGRHANREIRDAARVPGVVYGQKMAALSVSVGRASLDIKLHPTAGRIIHL